MRHPQAIGGNGVSGKNTNVVTIGIKVKGGMKMEMRSFRFLEYFLAFVHVTQQLEEEQERDALLDAARLDTPIVDEMLRELELLKVSDQGEESKDAASRALFRDMKVFLALRHLEQQKQAKEAASVFPRVASN